MPCYAVATAEALINNTLFYGLLDKALLRQIADLVAQETGLEITRRDYIHQNWVSDISIGGGGMVGIAILDNGAVAVKIASYNGSDTPAAQAYKQALETKIGAVAAALLGQKIGALMQGQGAQDLQTSYKANGTAVIKFKA